MGIFHTDFDITGDGKIGGDLFQSVNNGLTALAGGGQTGATNLDKVINRVGTVATIGDSTLLPAAKAGMTRIVKNSGAAAVDVYPRTGQTIDALAANVAIRVNAGTTVAFYCSTDGAWHSTPTPLPAAKYVKNTTSGSTTAAAGDLTGAAYVSAEFSAVAAGGNANLTTRTATQMFNDSGNVRPGDSYTLEIINTSANIVTVLAGSGVTLTGTMTLATNTTRRFNVTFTSATALVIQSVGVGTIS